MDFSAVVSKARQLLTHNASRSSLGGEQVQLTEPRGRGGVSVREVIYGRVCTTKGEEPPTMLSSDGDRKSVFLFGPDAVESIIVKQSAYGILCSIGRDKDYLHHTVYIGTSE